MNYFQELPIREDGLTDEGWHSVNKYNYFVPQQLL